MLNQDKKLTDYPQPAVAIDLALLSVVDGSLKVLLMRRKDGAEVGGDWALPGGFIHIDKSVDETVERVLNEKAHVPNAYLEQLGTFGALDRDPRGRVLSVAYFGLTPMEALQKAIDGSTDLQLAEILVRWKGEEGTPVEVAEDSGALLKLAFDHAEILGQVVNRLRGKLDYTAVGFELLPTRFTLRDVQEIHEVILGKELLKPAFRRKLLDRGWVRPTGDREAGSAFRPAELYERMYPDERTS
ncbi:MAG: NUDIX domain-containing protein [Stappiaceae bacterium]